VTPSSDGDGVLGQYPAKTCTAGQPFCRLQGLWFTPQRLRCVDIKEMGLLQERDTRSPIFSYSTQLLRAHRCHAGRPGPLKTPANLVPIVHVAKPSIFVRFHKV
jgi:hypothetical protein